MLKLRARIEDLTSKQGVSVITLAGNRSPEEVEPYKDKDLDVEIKEHKDRRSLDANACLWACLGELAGTLGFTNWDMYLIELKAYGQFVNVRIREEALPAFAKNWRTVDEVGSETVIEEIINPDTGYPEDREVTYKYVNCYFGSHTYNTKEFSRLLSGVIEDMKSAGLTPPPSEDMRRMLREMEQKENK